MDEVVSLRFQVPMGTRDRLAWQTEQMYYVRQNEGKKSGDYPWEVMRLSPGGEEKSVRLFREVQHCTEYTRSVQAGLLLDPKTPTMKGEVQ